MLKGLGRLAALLLLASAMAAPAWAGNTLYINSQPGDPMGAGQQVTFKSHTARFQASTNSTDLIRVSVDSFDSTGQWSLDFVPPVNTGLALGVYSTSTQYPFKQPEQPGLLVSSGRVICNTTVGRFVIRDLAIVNGTITRFAVDFEQHCNGITPALTGALRFNSAVPVTVQEPTADAGPDQYAVAGESVELAGSVFSQGGGTIAGRQWTQLSGPSVILADATDPGTSFAAPIVPPGGADVVLQFTLTNSLALTASDTVTIHVRNPSDPFNAFYLQGQSGDEITQGELLTVHQLDASFTGSIDVTNDVIVGIRGGNVMGGWATLFGPPGIGPLEVGYYNAAAGSRVLSPNAPIIIITGEDGSCDNAYGRYHVRQLDVDGQGNLVDLAADFIDHCDIFGALLYGKIRFNSTVPIDDPNANAGDDQEAIEQSPVTLDGTATNGGHGNVTSYAWTQVSGTPVTLSDNSSAAPSFTAPPESPGGEKLVFQLDVGNSRGLTNSDQTMVIVHKQDDVKNLVYYIGGPDDPVGLGERRALSPLTHKVQVSTFFQGTLDVSYFAVSNAASWGFEFVMPNLQALAVGTYDNAIEPAAFNNTVPNMYVASPNGFCITLTGSYTIRDLQLDPKGKVSSLALDFSQYCGKALTPLRGAIRYNSAVPVELANSPVADAGPDQITANTTITLDGSKSTGVGGSITSYLWKQVDGPPVTLTDPTAPVTGFSFDKSLLSRAWVKFKFELIVVNSLGLQSEDMVTVATSGGTVPQSILYLQSDPGDPVGGGATVQELAPDASFLGSLLSPAGAQVSVTQGSTWTLAFAPPSGQRLRTGAIYKRAVKYVPGSGRSPSLYVDTGNSCSTVTGSFKVLEARYAGSTLMSFAADFEQHCNGSVPALHGVIRYNSTVPPSQ